MQAHPEAEGRAIVTSYYTEKLSGKRLRRCYEIASPRVRRYLEAEIRHVLGRLQADHAVLELGCGYGRVALRLVEKAARVVGVDVSGKSIAMARELAGDDSRLGFFEMNALELEFPDREFDSVVCLQNGICAFNVDQASLIRESLRVLRPGGVLLVSTYSDRFWAERLAWFEAQAAEGLVGEIDHEATGDGTIVCRDGFRAARMTAEDFERLCARAGVRADIVEIDASVVFCEILKDGPAGRCR